MTQETWRQLYQSEAQGVWSLWVVPAAFLLYVATVHRHPQAAAVEPRAARFMRAYATCFAVETMLDPFVGGPLLRWLGLAGGTLSTIVMVGFVLLGDFRVFLLVLGLLALSRGPLHLRPVAGDAARWTLVVPLVAVAGNAAWRAAAGALPEQSIWLVYELAFFVIALVWRQRLVPARLPADRPALHAYLRAVLAYVAVYYALWAVADVLILAGRDAGWALRMIPNQLYYSFYVPFVYARWYAAASTATQASR